MISISLSCSYLNRGVVEKLEVVNKKWVRVHLTPGSTTDGSVRFLQIIHDHQSDPLICILSGRALVQHRQCRFL